MIDSHCREHSILENDRDPLARFTVKVARASVNVIAGSMRVMRANHASDARSELPRLLKFGCEVSRLPHIFKLWCHATDHGHKEAKPFQRFGVPLVLDTPC